MTKNYNQTRSESRAYSELNQVKTWTNLVEASIKVGLNRTNTRETKPKQGLDLN